MQLQFDWEYKAIKNRISRQSFSHEQVCNEIERLSLEERYASLLVEDDRFSRKIVSYQGNKGEFVHGWIKYREGFSALLVDMLMDEFGIMPGDKILDPFAGSATALLVAKTKGVDAVGIEILPNCHLAWTAKSDYFNYDLNDLRGILNSLQILEPVPNNRHFPHIAITEGAFPQKTENDLMFFNQWVENLETSVMTKTLLRLILTSILEEISYTRKDGQYLRWDYRSDKVQKRNEIRLEQGKKPIKKIDLGDLPTVKDALARALSSIISDIAVLQRKSLLIESHQELIEGNTLLVLPALEANQFTTVITSPPYCNRYDYTRTYALELAFLGIGDEIFDLRQSLLSCTVENRSKSSILRDYYADLGQANRFDEIMNIAHSNPAFIEINAALEKRWDQGYMNNKGVLSMVKQYFTELTFVFAELFRTCKPGAYVAFVNDNVRYGGEVIPVDLLSTDLAREVGFEPQKVYVLPQRKGNSSQQMGRFGREELRKSITVWRKPLGGN
ncbi:MAG: hypothetical protein JXA78_15330 [Anaerolineales bacterium]|nr:hypothetical protein [Anaerolineales bacterium]